MKIYNVGKSDWHIVLFVRDVGRFLDENWTFS